VKVDSHFPSGMYATGTSIGNRALTARSATLLGRTEQSSPNAAQRRANGAGLDGEGADQAIIRVAAMLVIAFFRIIALIPETGNVLPQRRFTHDSPLAEHWRDIDAAVVRRGIGFCAHSDDRAHSLNEPAAREWQ
jgi:hypothetical protein